MPDIRDAVRDTVAYRTQPEQQHRTRPSRSQTTTAPIPPAKSTPKRSQSQDSATGIQEKPRSSATKPSRSKKGSKHADVIDKLDFTGVGPTFHHDGPFDACAPSRNKYTTKAPVSTWGTRPEDLRQGTGAYPAYPTGLFTEEHPEPPKKKVDAIAEAWGIHEPEPFEEFFAGGGGKSETPASSIYGGRTGHSSAQRARDEPREGRSRAPNAVRRTAVPPPQPIFVPEAEDPATDQPIAGSPPAGGGPKRSKSLMHRIRRMRDAPNVPVSDYDTPPPASPSTPTGQTYDSQQQTSSRPTHRHQNSFLGRFGVKSSNPSAPSNAPNEPVEPYVYIDHQNKDKALPVTPMDRSVSDTSPQLGYSNYSGDASQQLGRKTSLMKKVGRVVRGGR